MFSQKRTFSYLRSRAKEVVNNLGWADYHTPDNLSLFLIGEVAEFGEYCQWSSFEQLQEKNVLPCVCEEIADIVKCNLYLINSLKLESTIEILLVNRIEMQKQIYYEEQSTKRLTNLCKKQQSNLDDFSILFSREKPTEIKLIEIQNMVWELISNREAKHIYNPTNLALSIAIKSGKIATYYQNRVVQSHNSNYQVFLVIADILIDIMLFCEYLAIKDLDRIVCNKFKKDEERYWRKAN